MTGSNVHLLADIGGTNARFAMSKGDGAITDVQVLPVADFARFEDALASYVAQSNRVVANVVIAAAGPVIDGCIRMTNADWKISSEAVQSICGSVQVHILNDLEAVALSLPALRKTDLRTLHEGCKPATQAPLLCVNIGTGFGAAVALFSHNRWHTLSTEAGHMPLALQSSKDQLMLKSGVHVEDVLSGPGLAELRQSHGDGTQLKRFFSSTMGCVAGDLILATGSWGGLYLCGGVLQSIDQVVEINCFLESLHNRKGLAGSLQSVPVHHITCPNPAYTGMQQLLSLPR
ncbi:MAG: ROK family protein [Paracoccaceae bacterium]